MLRVRLAYRSVAFLVGWWLVGCWSFVPCFASSVAYLCATYLAVRIFVRKSVLTYTGM